MLVNFRVSTVPLIKNVRLHMLCYIPENSYIFAQTSMFRLYYHLTYSVLFALLSVFPSVMFLPLFYSLYNYFRSYFLFNFCCLYRDLNTRVHVVQQQGVQLHVDLHAASGVHS